MACSAENRNLCRVHINIKLCRLHVTLKQIEFGDVIYRHKLIDKHLSMFVEDKKEAKLCF